MFFTLLVDYMRWHYGEALIQYIRILKTWWWFVLAYFSVPLLITTFFSPFKRLYEPKSDHISLGNLVERLLINTLSRIIGAGVRLLLLATAFILMGMLTIGGIIGYAMWLIAPGIPALLTGAGLLLLIGSLLHI